MAHRDQDLPPGQRRTGIIRRGALLRSRQASARNDWLAVVSVAFLAVIVVAVLVNLFGGGPAAAPASPDASPGSTLVAVISPGSTGGAMPSPTSSPSPSPTASPSPTSSPSPSPTASPSPSPSPSPTASPLPNVSPAPAPTMPANGLVIIEPADGATVNEQFVVVRGLARPGSVITRDIPFWFDDHTTADSTGLWSFAVSLNDGNNTLTFRVGDDLSTAQTLTVTYRQR